MDNLEAMMCDPIVREQAVFANIKASDERIFTLRDDDLIQVPECLG